MPERFRNFVENNAFGVCTYLGEKFDIATSKIRLYFIYLSFLPLAVLLLSTFLLPFG
jgi:phage shock protein C